MKYTILAAILLVGCATPNKVPEVGCWALEDKFELITCLRARTDPPPTPSAWDIESAQRQGMTYYRSQLERNRSYTFYPFYSRHRRHK